VPAIVALGCAADPDEGLSADAQRGQRIAADSGCMACHGPSGPAGDFSGLAGSTVTLTDGTTVVADTAYLVESIVDPAARLVAGYEQQLMPVNRLTDDEVALVVAYIEALPAG
jgi:mono/diheme cytochrome c family protein